MSNPLSTPTAPFHDRVHDWMVACFTPEVVGDKVERNHRFLEESLELVQSLGCTRDEAHMLVDYVFCRPVGEPTQETGGVMVTLSALCNANDIVPTTAADIELARCWTKIDVIRAKQAGKPKHSPLPGPSNETSGSQQGYVDAFYEISKLLDIPALPVSPKEAFETVMLPRLRELLNISPLGPHVGSERNPHYEGLFPGESEDERTARLRAATQSEEPSR